MRRPHPLRACQSVNPVRAMPCLLQGVWVMACQLHHRRDVAGAWRPWAGACGPTWWLLLAALTRGCRQPQPQPLHQPPRTCLPLQDLGLVAVGDMGSSPSNPLSKQPSFEAAAAPPADETPTLAHGLAAAAPARPHADGAAAEGSTNAAMLGSVVAMRAFQRSDVSLPGTSMLQQHEEPVAPAGDESGGSPSRPAAATSPARRHRRSRSAGDSFPEVAAGHAGSSGDAGSAWQQRPGTAHRVSASTSGLVLSRQPAAQGSPGSHAFTRPATAGASVATNTGGLEGAGVRGSQEGGGREEVEAPWRSSAGLRLSTDSYADASVAGLRMSDSGGGKQARRSSKEAVRSIFEKQQVRAGARGWRACRGQQQPTTPLRVAPRHAMCPARRAQPSMLRPLPCGVQAQIRRLEASNTELQERLIQVQTALADSQAEVTAATAARARAEAAAEAVTAKVGAGGGRRTPGGWGRQSDGVGRAAKGRPRGPGVIALVAAADASPVAHPVCVSCRCPCRLPACLAGAGARCRGPAGEHGQAAGPAAAGAAEGQRAAGGEGEGAAGRRGGAERAERRSRGSEEAAGCRSEGGGKGHLQEGVLLQPTSGGGPAPAHFRRGSCSSPETPLP
jgi:hypothetical protein